MTKIFLGYLCGPEKGRFIVLCLGRGGLLGSGIFRHCLGTLTHSMLGQFSRKKKANSRLNLATADCRLLVVLR